MFTTTNTLTTRTRTTYIIVNLSTYEITSGRRNIL